MGSQPYRKTKTTFDHKLLQKDLASEISVIKSDERKKKSSVKTLDIHQIEHLPKNDPEHFIYFLCSKFDALKELSLDDELDDGNQIQIRKIDINKKVFPRKSNHVKFSQTSNKKLNDAKINKTMHQTTIQFSCKNDIKEKFNNIDNLETKSKSNKVITFILNEGDFKGQKKSKFCHQKNRAKSTKNKDYIKNTTLSTIKSKKSEWSKEINNNGGKSINGEDSLDLIKILEEMGN